VRLLYHVALNCAHAPQSQGKNVCAGQRLAKLELKMIAAMFVAGFAYSVVDQNGEQPDLTPDWNDALSCRPVQPIQLAYRRIESIPYL
jgi:cytochrome P450